MNLQDPTTEIVEDFAGDRLLILLKSEFSQVEFVV